MKAIRDYIVVLASFCFLVVMCALFFQWRYGYDWETVTIWVVVALGIFGVLLWQFLCSATGKNIRWTVVLSGTFLCAAIFVAATWSYCKCRADSGGRTVYFGETVEVRLVR